MLGEVLRSGVFQPGAGWPYRRLYGELLEVDREPLLVAVGVAYTEDGLGERGGRASRVRHLRTESDHQTLSFGLAMPSPRSTGGSTEWGTPVRGSSETDSVGQYRIIGIIHHLHGEKWFSGWRSWSAGASLSIV